MAQPSSSNRDRDHDRRTERTERTDRGDRGDREERHRERERERERAERRAEREGRSSRTHHHHRTVSSTTLLLVLSLVLAVLAVMLSLPSGGLPAVGGTADSPDGQPQKGVWGILTPKRSQELVRRETDVAKREAEVARREAEMLAGAPGGILGQSQPPPPVMAAPLSCPPCPSMVIPEPMTIIKEVLRETEALAVPGWFDESKMRFQDILDRELKIADREREIGRREEQVNRREHDASRREGWIMEQLITIGNEEQPVVEEEYVYDTPRQHRRTPKYLPIEQEQLPPLILTETAVAIEYKTVTHTQHHTHTMPSETITVPAPANTRVAQAPTPEPHTIGWTTSGPRTTSVQFIHERIVEVEPEPELAVLDVVEETTTKTRLAAMTNRPAPKRWSNW